MGMSTMSTGTVLRMPSDLTDLEIDEIGFVGKGANQRARIVLHKADTQEGVAKGDAAVRNSEVIQLLGEHQREAAARREAALVNSRVSPFQRLMDPEVAAAYDAAYGRPVDHDARIRP